MSAGSSLDHQISLAMSADEAFALRHLLVWFEGLAADGQVITPEAIVAQFTPVELEILAGLRRVLVEHDFPAMRRP